MRNCISLNNHRPIYAPTDVLDKDLYNKAVKNIYFNYQLRCFEWNVKIPLQYVYDTLNEDDLYHLQCNICLLSIPIDRTYYKNTENTFCNECWNNQISQTQKILKNRLKYTSTERASALEQYYKLLKYNELKTQSSFINVNDWIILLKYSTGTQESVLLCQNLNFTSDNYKTFIILIVYENKVIDLIFNSDLDIDEMMDIILQKTD